jgi:RNA polymerase sigma-70 factor (ECF subfamily)
MNEMRAEPKVQPQLPRETDAQQLLHRLYQDHHRRVYCLALRLVGGDEVAAGEITQEVFVRAWRGLHGFRGDAQVTTWLHKIAVRVAHTYWRGEQQRRARAEIDADRVPSSALPNTDDDLERAIALLSPRERAAVVLHYIEGYTQAETGKLMGVAEGTIKSLVHRARARLREQLEEWS